MEPEHTTSFTHPATTTPEQRTPVVPSGPEKLPLEVSTIQLDFNSFVSSITIGPSGNLIVTDVHAVWNVDIEVNPPTKHLIAGSSSPGHVEGTGSVARFRGPRDVVMLNDSLILVTDQANHCLRAVDLHTNSTSTYAGLCGSRGNTNGHRLDARFYHLIGLLKLMNKIFISDFRNNAIRKLESDNVTTLSAGSPLTSPEHFSAWSDEFFFVTVNYGIARINLGTEPVTGELVSGSNFWGFANGNLSSSRYTNTLGIDHLDEHTLAVADEHNDRLRIVDLKNNNVTSICSGVDNSSVDGNGSDCSFNVPWGVRVYKDMILVGEKDKIRSLPLYSIIAKSANESERTTANKESVNTPGPEPITPAPIQGPESVYLSLLSIVVIIPVIVIVVVYCKRRRAGSESSADGERDINMVLQQKSCHERPLPHEPPCVWEDTEYAEINPETGAAKEDQEEEPYMRPTDSSYIEVYELPDSHRTASLYKNLPNYN